MLGISFRNVIILLMDNAVSDIVLEVLTSSGDWRDGVEQNPRRSIDCRKATCLGNLANIVVE